MDSRVEYIRLKINSFRRKYYLGFFIRGVAITLSFVLLYFLAISLVEYFFWLGRAWRLVLFLSLIAGWGIVIFLFLKKPLSWYFFRKGLNQEDSAKIIGQFIPVVGDTLLNLIQLSRHKKSSKLLRAGIEQKAEALNDVAFERALNLGKSKRYLWLLTFPIGVITVLLLASPSTLTQGAKRIVQFNQTFSPPALFAFHVKTSPLHVFKNEDFTLRVHLSGKALPSTVYIRSGMQLLKMGSVSPSDYVYTFKKVNAEIPFRLEAQGVSSDSLLVQLMYRPELTQVKIELSFPPYLARPKEVLSNTGNLEVPEGTRVLWEIGTQNTTAAKITFAPSGRNLPLSSKSNYRFVNRATIHNPEAYWVILENNQNNSKDSIAYHIDVIKDQYPQLSVDRFSDSTLFSYLVLGGRISDDYGVTALRLHYQKVGATQNEKSKTIPISIQKGKQQQTFMYTWPVEWMDPGDKINYFLEVWDNDGVNGPKVTRSSTYTFSRPDEATIKNDLAQSQTQTESHLKQGLEDTKSLNNMIDQARQQLKGKRSAGWPEKTLLEEILKKKDSLSTAINQLQQQQEQLNKKRNAFLEQDMKINEKTRQIQQLMENLFDKETKALFEELQRLLQENANLEQVKNVLSKIDLKGKGVEQALERMLALLNQLKFDRALDQTLHDLQRSIDQQKELLESTQKNTTNKLTEKHGRTGKKANKRDKGQNLPKENSSLIKKQQQLINRSARLQEALSELQKIGENIAHKPSTPTPKEADIIQDHQEKSQQFLKQQDNETAEVWQKKSIDKMRQMKKELETVQKMQQLSLDQENIGSLRYILHDLIRLSKNQESLMINYRNVSVSDPRYVVFSQQQFKLQKDYKMLKDSLLSLSKKDPFISSAIIREVGELDYHLDEVLQHIRERQQNNGQAEMQWSMTKMNNLALLLDDHLDMMMNAPSSSGGPNRAPHLSEMQKKLNQQIMELKKSGNSGRPLTEELAKLAAEQEHIRRALQKAEETFKKIGGKPSSGDVANKMKETEMDLLNKRIIEKTIKRQKEILTRLLDVEHSMREQGLDKERKGVVAKEYQKNLPKVFEEYLKQKQKEVELLNTMPPKLNFYYKQETNQYFKRINNN